MVFSRTAPRVSADVGDELLKSKGRLPNGVLAEALKREGFIDHCGG